ncbi:MAG: phosphotransferase [Anaerolineae bacterium]|nr:phosphotransferase [Anaerolineae bacterium]
MSLAIFHELNQFEETITAIAAYLLVAGQKHPRHILGKPEDHVLDVRSSIRMRVTRHYTAALMTYGLGSDTPELEWAAEWFATPFPKATFDVIDTIEMTRLEGLLSLRPDDPTVYPRLEQLVRQKNDYYFEIDRADHQESTTAVFDTLWALKVLMLARQKNMLNGLISKDEIKASLDRITEIAVYDKDIALALRLQYDLMGALEPRHEDLLKRLIQRSVDYQHVWGINRQDTWERVKTIVEAMEKRQLTPGIIDQQSDTFREIILNLCYVIENLAPLPEQYRDLHEALRQSLQLWWRQFQGEHAPANIRTLFADEYDYLMVMCRTLIAVGALVNEPLSTLCWLPLLRKMSQNFDTPEWEEADNIKKALREWIEIELGEPGMLKLGLSEANVVRIKPGIFNPMDDARDNMLRTSLIVKYGPADEIERERENYNQLPGRIRGSFVSIPDASYTDEKRQRAFVIMQDLNNYQTLFEIYDRLLKPDNPRVGGLLSEFLLNVHRGDGEAIALSRTNHLREIYLLPMMQHLNYITAHMQNRDIVSDDDLTRFYQVEQQLNHLLAGIMQHQQQIPAFPLAYMHGDLHSRNIMIRTQQKSGVARRAEHEFRLIDLESLRLDGDAAHDAGQLVVDLSLLQISGKKNLHRSIYVKLADMQLEIVRSYLTFAEERGDTSFVLRLELAKARALIRIAKGHAKRSALHLNQREYQKALDFITEILHLTEESVEHLRQVYNEICLPV